LTELSSFHFSRVFKQSTGMTPLQFVIRERMLKAQQLIRETSRGLIEIALEVGYTSPSHFAQVFRRTAGMAPTEFRMLLEEEEPTSFTNPDPKSKPCRGKKLTSW